MLKELLKQFLGVRPTKEATEQYSGQLKILQIVQGFELGTLASALQ